MQFFQADYSIDQVHPCFFQGIHEELVNSYLYMFSVFLSVTVLHPALLAKICSDTCEEEYNFQSHNFSSNTTPLKTRKEIQSPFVMSIIPLMDNLACPETILQKFEAGVVLISVISLAIDYFKVWIRALHTALAKV